MPLSNIGIYIIPSVEPTVRVFNFTFTSAQPGHLAQHLRVQTYHDHIEYTKQVTGQAKP